MNNLSIILTVLYSVAYRSNLPVVRVVSLATGGQNRLGQIMHENLQSLNFSDPQDKSSTSRTVIDKL